MTRSWIGSLSKLTLAIVIAFAMSSAPLGCSQKKHHAGKHPKCMKSCDKCPDKAGCKSKAGCSCKGKARCGCKDKASCGCKDKASCSCKDMPGCKCKKSCAQKSKDGKKPCCPKEAMQQKQEVKKAEPKKQEGK